MATGSYSHGKSKGTSDRKSSGRLAALGGTTGPIKKYDLKGDVGPTPKFKTITGDYYQSQALNVPPPVQIPDAPTAPDDSQNLRNLAAAFGDVNSKLNAFIPEFWNFQESMDKAARREAERRAAEGEKEEKVNLSNKELNKAKGIIETKGKTDPEAKAAYGLFASMDQRVEREYGVVVAKNRGLNAISNIENYAKEIYENSLNDPSRADDSGKIIPVNPGTSEFTELLLDKIKGEINNPQAYLELQSQVQAGILTARRSVSTIHSKWKDNTASQSLNLGIGSVIVDGANASQERLTGMGTEWTTDQEIDDPGTEVQAFTPLSFTQTIDDFRLKSGTSIENYQKNTDPITLLTNIAASTVNNIDRGDLPDAIDTVETMLMNTRLGAGDGQLLSDMVGGKEVLKKLWERAISNARNEAYKLNDQVAVKGAEEQAGAWAQKVFDNDEDADFVEDGFQEFGDETTYTMTVDGVDVEYKLKTPPNAINLQGVLAHFANEKKNAYKLFETGVEIRAYQKELDDQLKGWLQSRGMDQQNANEKWLRDRIKKSNNPIETEALIIHFGNQKWITKEQKSLLLQDAQLKEKIKTQRNNFDETMKEPYKNVESKLGTLFQLLDPNRELEPEKWSADNQTIYRNTIQEFKSDVEDIFGALNQDDYATRIQKIKVLEQKLIKDLDDKIVMAREGKNPYDVSVSDTTITTDKTTDKTTDTGTNTTTDTDTEEGPPVTISKEEYNQLPSIDKKLYQPVPRGNEDRLTPGAGWIKEYTLRENVEQSNDLRSYLQRQGLKGLFGFERGRGDVRANKDLRLEVETTPIYDRKILEAQINRLEQLSQEFPNGIDWQRLSKESGFMMRNRNDLDYKALDVLLQRTGLTPREFFQSQINAHGLPTPPGLFDRLFPTPESSISLEEFQRLNPGEKNLYKKDGSNRFILKKNNKQASSVLDRGILVASTNLEGVLGNPQKEIETKMLDIIHSGESTVDVKGGGYEAFNQGGSDEGETVLGFSGTYGDHPANKGKKLTEMTIQEILEIQDSGYDSDIYPWTAEGTKKWQDSGGIHAAGRYQFIRSGLRDAMELAGIKPTEKFTPEIQDRLAIALLINRGPDRWTSMKGNKELIKLLEQYKKTDWTKSSNMSVRPDIA